MNYAKYMDLKSNDFRTGLIIELRIENSSLVRPTVESHGRTNDIINIYLIYY